MKRTLLAVALATLTLGAAQASTLNWDALSKVDGYNSLGTKTSGGETAVNLGNSASWTVACKVTVGELKAYTENNFFPSFIGVATGTNGPDRDPPAGTRKNPYRFNADMYSGDHTSGNIGLANGTRTEGVDAVAYTGNTTYEMVISYTAGVNGAAGTLNFYLNGVLYGTASGFNADIQYISWGKQGMNTNQSLFAGGNDPTLDIAYVEGLDYEGVKDAIAQSVPEPTALALLALGVAGLALRRRVA